jgi:hypothetical protein
MFKIDDTIDAFRRGALEFDCKHMVLSNAHRGERFEGSGYIRQLPDGSLTFKIYVTQHNAKAGDNIQALWNVRAGELHGDDIFYDLDATGEDGVHWTAARIYTMPNWDMSDMSVMINARLQSIIAELDVSQPRHYLRLNFFEEYEVPLRGKFEACESKFEVRKQRGSGETVVEVISDCPFPAAFDLRIQEALQYITAKTAMWRARLASQDKKLYLELASPSPWAHSPRTQFNPPISPADIHFHNSGWSLFTKYLTYVIRDTVGMHWNPVAYHLYNACEATANSLDSWAVGVCVAVEAVASLICVQDDEKKAKQVALLQERMRKWFAEQTDFHSLADRVNGTINALSQKRPQDTLYALAQTGHVEKDYIKAWRDLRGRQVHPKLNDLERPDLADYQKLIDKIHRTEVLLRQLTFYLIGYEGPFTDYGVHGRQGFPSKQYPLKVE